MSQGHWDYYLLPQVKSPLFLMIGWYLRFLCYLLEIFLFTRIIVAV